MEMRNLDIQELDRQLRAMESAAESMMSHIREARASIANGDRGGAVLHTMIALQALGIPEGFKPE